MSFVNGKRVIVTGANSGIGLACARAICARGGNVVMVCRDAQRGEAARALILAEHPQATIDLQVADLARRDAIQSLVQRLHDQYTSIDVLINNAGVLMYDRVEDADGLEYTFALNHLGYFRLTSGILDLLRAGGNSRVVSVASRAHQYARFDLDDLQHTRSYSPFTAYGASKLANILFTRELARRETAAGSGVIAGAVHPGFVKTNFGGLHWNRPSAVVFQALAALFAVPPEHGARGLVALADGPAFVNGGYFASAKDGARPAKNAAIADDAQVARRLWEISEQLA